MTKPARIVLLVSACLATGLGAAPRASAAPPDPRQAAITQTAQAFVDAFRRADAKAVAAFWAPDGDFIDMDGRVLSGRQAIEDDFAAFFKESPGLQVRIEVASIRFLTPDIAIEDGTTSMLTSDGSVPSRARYTNVLVNKDGKWLLASVREAPYVPPNNQEHLRGLDWTIGEWVDEATDGHVAHVNFEWSPDRNFILCSRAVDVNGAFLDNGTQRIGWDPSAGQIHSWSFEPDGGFGEATWTPTGDNTWTVKSSAVLQSGHKLSATTIVTRVDEDTVTMKATNQTVNGKSIPDTAVITMKRMK